MKRLSRSPHANAFSLVEMLVVVSIIAFLAALTVGSMKGVGGSRQLVNGGNLVVDLANQARQNSISKNTLTALFLVASTGREEIDRQLFLLADLEQNADGTSTWVPITKWEALPRGIVVDTDQSVFPTLATPPSDLESQLVLKYGGRPVFFSALLYQVFTPDGHLLPDNASTPTTPLIVLVEGTMQGGRLVRTTKRNDLYQITLNPYTGIPIVDRDRSTR